MTARALKLGGERVLPMQATIAAASRQFVYSKKLPSLLLVSVQIVGVDGQERRLDSCPWTAYNTQAATSGTSIIRQPNGERLIEDGYFHGHGERAEMFEFGGQSSLYGGPVYFVMECLNEHATASLTLDAIWRYREVLNG